MFETELPDWFGHALKNYLCIIRQKNKVKLLKLLKFILSFLSKWVEMTLQLMTLHLICPDIVTWNDLIWIWGIFIGWRIHFNFNHVGTLGQKIILQNTV